MDVKSAFLNGNLNEEVYIEQPEGFEVPGKESKVLKLKKALYGLKQAPRAWNLRIDSYFKSRGFMKCQHEHALYVKKNKTDLLIVCLYVDDLIFTGSSASMIEGFKKDLEAEFEMTDIGLMSYYLGIEVRQRNDVIFISQKGYAKEVLEKFNMLDCKSLSVPIEVGEKLSKARSSKQKTLRSKRRSKEEGGLIDIEGLVDPTLFKSLVGSLRYLTCTRPDILYAVGLVSRYMECPTVHHFDTAKKILRYIKGSLELGLFYPRSGEEKLVGFCDSDWAGDIDDRKSTTGFVFRFGETAFTWSSKKQQIVTLSTCEAEYVAATSSVCHAVWLRSLLEELGLAPSEATEIFVDNKSAIALAKNPVFHDRSKHIDTRYHYIRGKLDSKEIELKFVKTEDQLADIFTKPLKREIFEKLRSKLGMRSSSLGESVGS